MQCARCQQDNSSHAKFCLECGTPIGTPVATLRPYSELQAETQELRRSLTEALDQQTATAEILGVISRSPTDVQAIFDTIAERAVRLCRAKQAIVITFDGELMHIASLARVEVESLDLLLQKLWPRRPDHLTIFGRTILTKAAVHVPSVEDDPEYAEDAAEFARLSGFRSGLAVPMLRDGKVIGAIGVARRAQGAFTPPEISLLKTFADQAVIAIENVRLFTELQEKNKALTQAHAQVTEALDKQTATGEILRVIASSPTDVQPVFNTIAMSAARLCKALDAVIWRLDGDMLRLAAHHGPIPFGPIGEFSVPCSPDTVTGRTILTRQTIQIEDLASAHDEYPQGAVHARRFGYRTFLSTPLLRQGLPVGTIAIRRTEIRQFSDDQIALLQTFADQAVIAIENVRLFKDLDTRNSQLTEALEQQTATAEILRVISRSPTDVQPVFDAICRSAVRLCGAYGGLITSFDGTLVHLAAVFSPSPDANERVRREYPRRPDADAARDRAILARAVIQIPDTEADSQYTRQVARQFGYRRLLYVPMLRDGQPIGSIGVSGREPGPYTEQQIALLQTFAAQAVIAIENVRLFTELQEKNRALTIAHERVTEALDQQTATSEILSVISSSPTDVQPVFDIIAKRATALTNAVYSAVYLVENESIHLRAYYSEDIPNARQFAAVFPMPITSETLIAGTLRTGTMAHIPDMEAVSVPERGRLLARTLGVRSTLTVPMRRDGDPIGAIGVNRRQPGDFTPAEIALLQTFADQAVIAIENVRLFTETKQALERQTATGEILRVISSSVNDLRPIFATILASAARLCNAHRGALLLFKDGLFETGAELGAPAGLSEARKGPYRPHPDTVIGRMLVERRAIYKADLLADPLYREGEPRTVAAAEGGSRSLLAVPLLKDSAVIGAITIHRPEPGPFFDDHIALLQTFADQAVIAIENVRLFRELETRNRDVTEALEQQTATSEILRVISSSLTDVQPVFDAIAAAATRLCDAVNGLVMPFDGQRIHLAAHYNVDPERLDALRRIYPMPPNPGAVSGRVILRRAVVHVPDVNEDRAYTLPAATTVGYRSVLGVPLLRDGLPLGMILIARDRVAPFSDTQIALLQTFADQAVIAIENVRLFQELQTRTQDLARSVGELQALGEVSQAVSSTLDLGTVLETIVSRAVQLSGSDQGIVYEFDDGAEVFQARATHRITPKHLETVHAMPIRLGEGAIGRAGVIREPVQVADTQDEWQLVAPQVRELLLREGLRSLLAIPLVREQRLLGGLVILRHQPGAFATDVVSILQTFATQSVLAIQNARLFRELADKSSQLEAASQHKSEFLANMSHELRTPLNAIIGFSEVLTDRMFGELNEKQEEYLKDIYASGTHLLSLINDILDLSKIEAGRMELELTDFDLPTALDNALMLVRERAQRRSIALHTSIDNRLGQIQGDERKIRQVVLNLLSNAIKFTPEGGRIEVAAVPKDGLVEVSVCDTGVGIAPEDQEKVFEEFRQVGTADKKAEGTGLGLTLCRKFIELHGGRIWVKSQVGVGSAFTFTIPVRHGD